jgi:ADP-ribose pyrophosphatase
MMSGALTLERSAMAATVRDARTFYLDSPGAHLDPAQCRYNRRRPQTGRANVSDARRVLHHGRIVDVCEEEVTLPNGSRLTLEIVRHPGGAAVVAINDRDEVCLLRQYRHVAGGWIWEIPAGKLEPGRTPLDMAQRELEEEAGLQARHWKPLGEVLSSPGIFTEAIYLFLARDLVFVPSRHEAHEVIEVHWKPFAEVVAMAASGEITDGKTIAGLFRAQSRLGIGEAC